MSAASMFTIFLLVSSAKALVWLYSCIICSPPGLLARMDSTSFVLNEYKQINQFKEAED